MIIDVSALRGDYKTYEIDQVGLKSNDNPADALFKFHCNDALYNHMY